MSNGAREQLRGTVSRTDYWRTLTFNSSVSDCQHSADGLRETLPHPVSPTSSRDLPGRGCGHNQLHPVILRFLPSCIKELGKFQAYYAVISRRLPGIWKLCMREEPLLLLRLPGPTAESQEKSPLTVCTDFPQTDTAGSLQSHTNPPSSVSPVATEAVLPFIFCRRAKTDGNSLFLKVESQSATPSERRRQSPFATVITVGPQ